MKILNRFVLSLFIMSLSYQVLAAPGDLLQLKELKSLTKDEIKTNNGYCASGFGDPPIENKIADASIRTFAIQYETLDIHGKATIASGAFAFPVIKGPLSVVSYHHGSVFHRDEVPSRGDFMSRIIFSCYGSQGYAIAAADYLGYGDSTVYHPYLEVEPAAVTAIDLLRALRHASKQLKVDLNSKLFLTGYSQGGAVAMGVQRKIEKAAANEFKVTASAPMAGPYDLEFTNMSILKKASPYSPAYYAYRVWSMHKIGKLSQPVSEIIQKPYADQLKKLFDGTVETMKVMKALPEDMEDLLVPEFVVAMQSNPNHPYRLLLRENSVFNWKPLAPVRILHGANDDIVPIENMIKACEHMKKLGASVTCEVVDTDHLYFGWQTMMMKAMYWFNSF